MSSGRVGNELDGYYYWNEGTKMGVSSVHHVELVGCGKHIRKRPRNERKDSFHRRRGRLVLLDWIVLADIASFTLVPLK